MSQADVSALLAGAAGGDSRSKSRLFEAVYDELRRIAGAALRDERPDHTLQPSALVHEAYLRLLGRTRPGWANRAHFFTTAAGTMRRILIDHARRRSARKRQAATMRSTGLDLQPIAFADRDLDRLLAVDAALEKLARWDRRLAKVVELRFFGGLTVDETADVLRISPKTVKRDWSIARAWLQTEIEGPPRGD